MTENTFRIKDVIKGCQENAIGFKELMYKSFYGYVMGVIVRYISNSFDAQELVNDSFIKIFKHISSFESTSISDDVYTKSFKGWIAKIASRTAIDHLRKDKNNFLTEELDKINYQLYPVQISHEIHVKEIMALLNKLPPTHKFIFNLHEVEGFSHDEIAQMLKIPASSSRVFLGRAKNKLRELYAQTFNEQFHK